MDSVSNSEIVRRILERGFAAGDLSVVDEYVAPDFVEHQDGAQGVGPEAVKGVIRGLHASLSDLHLHIDDMVEAGDDVWVRMRARATNTKPIMGRPATGRSMEIQIIDVIRLRDGKLVEHWGVADRLAMLQQLGVVPRPEGKTSESRAA